MGQTLLATVGVLVVGSMTPGPANFVVMREAGRAGWRGALSATAGIVAGTLALLLLVYAGVGAALAAAPRFAAAVATVGCAYLLGLGLRLAAARCSAARERWPRPPVEEWGLVAFQLLNPKAWLLVLTVTASAQAELGPRLALPGLITLFTLVPATCLALWAWTGVALERRLRSPATRALIDRAMGMLLIASAALLLIDTWR
jgi:threonine/homoserine/homoserine lactone efflux protein